MTTPSTPPAPPTTPFASPLAGAQPGASTKPFAVVTGASSGIGLEMAKELARRDFDVLVTAEDAELDAAAAQVRELGAEVTAVRVDLASFDGVEELWGAISATGRPVEALALNAGIGVVGDFARDTDLRDEIKVINLNVTSVVHLAKRVTPTMVARGSGKVLVTSSIEAATPGPYQAVYAASKAFLASFGESVRSELADSGVTVTVLQPGVTDTEFFERGGMEDTRVGQAKKDDPAKVAKQGVDAMLDGDAKVTAGSMANKVLTAAARVLPEPLKGAAHRPMSRPGGAE